MHLDLGWNWLIFFGWAKSKKLEHFFEASCFLLLLNQLTMEFIFDYFNLLCLSFNWSALPGIFFSFSYDLTSILFSNFELHHLLYMLHLIFILIRVVSVLVRLILISATIAVSTYARIACSLRNKLTVISLLSCMLTLIPIIFILVLIGHVIYTFRLRLVALIFSTFISISLFLAASLNIAWLLIKFHRVVIYIIVSLILSTTIFASFTLVGISWSLRALTSVFREFIGGLSLCSSFLTLAIIIRCVPMGDIPLAALRLGSLLSFAVVVPLRSLHLNYINI